MYFTSAWKTNFDPTRAGILGIPNRSAAEVADELVDFFIAEWR